MSFVLFCHLFTSELVLFCVVRHKIATSVHFNDVIVRSNLTWIFRLRLLNSWYTSQLGRHSQGQIFAIHNSIKTLQSTVKPKKGSRSISVYFYLPMPAAPGCSASPPPPHSYSSSDRSTEAPLPAGTGTARAPHQQASVQAPPAIRPGRVQAQHQPTWSRGPRGVHSQSLLPSP